MSKTSIKIPPSFRSLDTSAESNTFHHSSQRLQLISYSSDQLKLLGWAQKRLPRLKQQIQSLFNSLLKNIMSTRDGDHYTCVQFLTDTYSSYLLARITFTWGMRSTQQPSDKHGASVWRLKQENTRQKTEGELMISNVAQKKSLKCWLQSHTYSDGHWMTIMIQKLHQY